VWIKIAGYKPHTEDRWINSDLISDIRWNAREGRYDLTMADQQGVQVYEAGGVAQIDRLVGAEPHEANPLYG
jgi:hypothetical protein